MARLETRAELARIAGVSAMAISKACNGGKLEPACKGHGLRVDLDHPVVQDYLRAKGVAPTALTSGVQKRVVAPTEPSPQPPDPDPPARQVGRPKQEPSSQAPDPDPTGRRGGRPKQELDPRTERGMAETEATGYLTELAIRLNVSELPRWTLQKLTEKFGTAQAIRDYLDARLKISSVEEKELKNKEHRGDLIDKQGVKTRVFGYIEETNRRLLQDFPKTVARDLYKRALAGTPVEEAEHEVRKLIATQLQQLSSQLKRAPK